MNNDATSEVGNQIEGIPLTREVLLTEIIRLDAVLDVLSHVMASLLDVLSKSGELSVAVRDVLTTAMASILDKMTAARLRVQMLNRKLSVGVTPPPAPAERRSGSSGAAADRPRRTPRR